MSVAEPRPLDGLRELRASAPNSSPKRLIISLPTDGDGLGLLLLDSSFIDLAGDGDDPGSPLVLLELHADRPGRPDALGLDGIALRRTNGEVKSSVK